MNDLERTLSACRRSISSGRPALLATVVHVEGSAYRRPGARMLLCHGEEPVGMISGGCVEADLRERFGLVMAGTRPEVVSYDLRSSKDWIWGLGLGCGGEVRVLLEPLPRSEMPPYLEFLERCLGRREPAVLVTVFAANARADVEVGDRLALDGSGPLRGGPRHEQLLRYFVVPAREALRERRSSIHAVLGEQGIEALVEYVPQIPHLLVFGAGSDAVPVVAFARELGWRVTVVDRREVQHNPSFALDDASAVVIMTHDFARDLDLLRWLVTTDIAYLGILGPQRRSAQLLEELEREGTRLTRIQQAKIHAPVGIDLGAESPAEIALAIVAEVQAVLGGRRGGFLRERTAPLHEPGCRQLDPR